MSNTITVTSTAGFCRVLKDQLGSQLPWIMSSTVKGGGQIVPGLWITIQPDSSNATGATITVLDPDEQKPTITFRATLQSDMEHMVSDPLPADSAGIAWTFTFYMNQVLLANGAPDQGTYTRRVLFCFDARGEASTNSPTRFQHDAGSSDPGYVPK